VKTSRVKKKTKQNKQETAQDDRACVCVCPYFIHPLPTTHRREELKPFKSRCQWGGQYKLKLFKVKMPMEANHIVSSHFIVVNGSIPLGYIAKHVPH
jgi:hypothetical protein